MASYLAGIKEQKELDVSSKFMRFKGFGVLSAFGSVQVKHG